MFCYKSTYRVALGVVTIYDKEEDIRNGDEEASASTTAYGNKTATVSVDRRAPLKCS